MQSLAEFRFLFRSDCAMKFHLLPCVQRIPDRGDSFLGKTLLRDNLGYPWGICKPMVRFRKRTLFYKIGQRESPFSLEIYTMSPESKPISKSLAPSNQPIIG